LLTSLQVYWVAMSNTAYACNKYDNMTLRADAPLEST